MCRRDRSLADAAGKAWARTTPRRRSDVLHAVYAKLIENRDDLALVMSREMGKTISEAYAEVQYAADYVRWFAEEALRAGGSYREAPQGGSTMILSLIHISSATHTAIATRHSKNQGTSIPNSVMRRPLVAKPKKPSSVMIAQK